MQAALRFSLTLAIVVSGLSGLYAAPLMGATGAEPVLTLPDGSTLVLPRGTDAFGLDGHRDGQPAQHPTPGSPHEPPRASEAAPPASAAEQRRQRLDDLFARLAGAQDATEAGAITQLIDRLWAQSGSPTADLLMQRAHQALLAKDEATAGLLLDKIVALRPGWAEAWNKRATIRYLADDDTGSMEDISHVLALEPRHFGALSGMGFILHRNGDDKAALTVLRRAAALNPQQPEIKALIEQLAPDVEGHDL